MWSIECVLGTYGQTGLSGEMRRKKFWEVALALFKQLVKEKLNEMNKLKKGIVL